MSFEQAVATILEQYELLKRENSRLVNENNRLARQLKQFKESKIESKEVKQEVEDDFGDESPEPSDFSSPLKGKERKKTSIPILKNEKWLQTDQRDLDSHPLAQNSDSQRSQNPQSPHHSNAHWSSPSYNSQIPTQYSDESSPAKRDTECVEDSEDDEIIHSRPKRAPMADITKKINIGVVPSPPKYYTKLQRQQQLVDFYTQKFHTDRNFTIDLSSNPIKEGPWVLSDFKPNGQYVKPSVPTKRGYSKAQQQSIEKFYSTANRGLPIKLTSKLQGSPELDIEGDGTHHLGHMTAIQGENLNPPPQRERQNSPLGKVARITESQLFDKVPSPPGFMVSEFPSSQEELARRRIVADRQHERLERRLALSLEPRGEFKFVYDILNQYVNTGRYEQPKRLV